MIARATNLQDAVEAAATPAPRPTMNGGAQLGGKTGVLAGRRMAQFARIEDGDYNGVAAHVLSQARAVSEPEKKA